MKVVQTLWIAICTLVTTQATTAATVTAKASSNSVQVAEPFTLEVIVTAEEGSKVTFPMIQEKLGEFDVHGQRDMFDVPSLDSNSQRIWDRRLILEAIVTGNLMIPSFDIQVSHAGTTTTLQTQPIPIDVLSVLEDRSDPTKFRDIESVVDVDVPTKESDTWVLAALAGAIVLTLLAFVTLAFWGRRGGMTPEDWAFEELNQLEASVKANTIDSRVAVERVADVIRYYLRFRLGTDQSGQTGQELLHEITSNERFDANLATRVHDVFELADKVKFAGLDSINVQVQHMINNSRELLQTMADQFNSNRGPQFVSEQVSPDSSAGLMGTPPASENR